MRLCLLAALSSTALLAQWPDLRLQRIASGLQNPTDIAAVPDGSGRLFVLEQPGRVRVILNGALVPRPVLTIPSLSSGGERGLLGIAFPPNFVSKRYFYVNYTDPQGASTISRFRFTGNENLVPPETEEVILRIPRNRSNHNGGGIAFGPDGYLYIGTGDSGGAGDPENAAQTPSELRGKMLRIDTESGQAPYAVPAGNPFTGQSAYRPEIWAIGLRNPWRYSFDRATRDLWIADVGQNRAEEVNFQAASSRGGENYGWRNVEGLQCYPSGSNCEPQRFVPPILEYTRNLGVSITGGYVYRGSRYPAMQGIYLFGDFGSGRIWGARSTGENQQLLQSGLNISAFGQDEAGELYLADHTGGSIYAISGGNTTLTAAGVVNAASFAPGFVPGSLATLFGTGISTLEGILQATNFPLPTELAGVSLLINGNPVPITAIARTGGNEQINFQVPWELTGASTASVAVRAYGVTSPAVDVPLTPAQPEIFAITRNAAGFTLWATGLGPVSVAQETGRAAAGEPLPVVSGTTSVTIGGVNAPATYSGLAIGFAGLYQVNVTASSAAAGDVLLRVGNAISRPFPLSRAQ